MARSNAQRTLLVILSFAAVLVVAAAVIIGIATRRPSEVPDVQEPSEPPAEFVLFPDLPRNTYDKNQFRYQNGYLTYQNGACLGIDVSSHQEQINWQKVKNAGVEFAILRVAYRGYTGGGLNTDPWFQTNFQGAAEAGVKVGAYIFSQAITVEEAREEALFVLDCLDGAPLDLPVFFDWEYVEGPSRTALITGSEITEFAQTFCSEIEKVGYRAGVYFNVSLGYTALNLSKLKDYDFWLAQYQDAPDFLFDFGYLQYTDSGSVPGIHGNVDLNLMFLK